MRRKGRVERHTLGSRAPRVSQLWFGVDCLLAAAATRYPADVAAAVRLVLHCAMYAASEARDGQLPLTYASGHVHSCRLTHAYCREVAHAIRRGS